MGHQDFQFSTSYFASWYFIVDTEKPVARAAAVAGGHLPARRFSTKIAMCSPFTAGPRPHLKPRAFTLAIPFFRLQPALAIPTADAAEIAIQFSELVVRVPLAKSPLAPPD